MSRVLSSLDQRIVEELIYERVKVDHDLLALIELERDLSESIGRALAAAGGDSEEVRALTRRSLDRAFDRLAAERGDDVEVDVEAGDCPLCEAPLACTS